MHVAVSAYTMSGIPNELAATRFDSMGSNSTVVGSDTGNAFNEKSGDGGSDRNPFPRRPWRKKACSWDAIRNHPYAGNGTESDPYVVTWLEADPENPHNYGFGYKWAITMMCAYRTRRG